MSEKTHTQAGADGRPPSLIALGRSAFVRLLQLGGICGQPVTAEKAAEALARHLDVGAAALVLFEADLLSALPAGLRRRAFQSQRPHVVAVGGKWNEILRSRIRQVAGADLLLPQDEK